VNRQEKIRALFDRAHDDLEAVSLLLREGHAGAAASRMYYALFYAASAALLDRGLEFSKHSAVIARFGREFVKDGPLDKNMFRTLDAAFAMRNRGDYGIVSMEREDVEALLPAARDFIEAVRAMLEPRG
jgi:uncharacterized protein (UPF0332 family)